jgi:hypothetical protein
MDKLKLIENILKVISTLAAAVISLIRTFGNISKLREAEA